MPVTNLKTAPELAAEAYALVKQWRRDRKDGFIVTEAMLREYFATAHGIVLPEGPSAAIYERVMAQFCPHALPLEAWSAPTINHIAASFRPAGIIGCMTFPEPRAVFSEEVDLVLFRLNLPAQHETGAA